MRKLLLLLGLLTVAFIGQAQKNKIFYYELDLIHGKLFQPNTIDPFTGTGVDEFPNGKKKLQVPIKDGKIHGTVKEWAQNGKKVYEATYEQGVQTGTERQWYATGNKKLEIAYQNGKAEGLCTEWFKNGQKKSEGLFTAGKEEGEHNWWYQTGEKDQVVFYKNGLANGLVHNWYRSGQSKLESAFKNGKKNGPTKEWYANGQLKSEVSYKEDVEDGEARVWSKQGMLLGLQVFEEGRLIEDYNYRSGNIRCKEGYIQVFNERNSFFRVDITGEREVLDRSGEVITYAVDGKLLQLYNVPTKRFFQGASDELSETDLLKKYRDYETAYIQKMTDFGIEVEEQWLNTQNGKSYLYWQFVSPSSQDEKQKARTVQREYYVSFVCKEHILSLYSVVTNSDEPEEIDQLLKRIAESIQEADERIDLNEVAREVVISKP